jgi:hypothetical protein
MAAPNLQDLLARAAADASRHGPMLTNLGGGAYSGSIVGANPTNYNPASGGVPGTTNPAGTITGNLGNIGNIIGGVTASQLEALRKQYPSDFFALQQMILENAKRRAAGDVSDLLPEMWTKNAENAVTGGYSGSELENTKRLRDLALTRLGLETGAEKSMTNVFGATPTVRPFDPSGVIQALVDAQAKADLYRAAPDPEAAYNRAKNAAGGPGGPAGTTGGVRYPGLAPGAGSTSTVDDILKRYGNNMGYFAAQGTLPSTYTSPGPVYGKTPMFDQPTINAGTPGVNENPDFAGSLTYAGGSPWGGVNPGAGGPLDFAGGANYQGNAPWSPFSDPFGTMLTPAGSTSQPNTVDNSNNYDDNYDALGGYFPTDEG